ncbi:MAG TPA: hypothetical protein VGO62_03500 [Myxococcota bacterium]|jgi:hypothetical protein
MSDSNKTSTEQPKTRVPPADAATPFHMFTNLWKTEMRRVLEESHTAMEKSFSEWEKNVAEASRFQAAQAHAMHDATRAFLEGTRVMLG